MRINPPDETPRRPAEPAAFPVPFDHPARRTGERLEILFRLGDPPLANRPGLSAGEERACELVGGWMREAGMEVRWDAAGNLLGHVAGTRRDVAEVWVGSHLDTVPAGGRFDGALGVVGAIEAVAGLPHPPAAGITVVAFRDEEGWRFGRSCFGSRALCGQLARGEMSTADAGGITVVEAQRRLGRACDPPARGWLEPRPACFVELHIEQGPVLARRDAPVGVVTTIVGMAECQVRFEGRRGHAGTTPMVGRADALRAAADYIERIMALAESLPGAVATVGTIDARPGAQNVIADDVELSLDLRCGDPGVLEQLCDRARLEAGAAAARHAGHAHFETRWRTAPMPMNERVRSALRAAMQRNGVPVAELPSGAGHDAAVLASAGVPTGMLFVRSLADGRSHSPDEHTADDDIAIAIAVLRAALAALADGGGALPRSA